MRQAAGEKAGRAVNAGIRSGLAALLPATPALAILPGVAHVSGTLASPALEGLQKIHGNFSRILYGELAESRAREVLGPA